MRCRKHLEQVPRMHLEMHSCSSEGDVGAVELGVISI